MDKDFKDNVIKGSFLTTFGRIASLTLHFFSTIIVIRIIAKEDYGIFSLILVFNAFLTIIGGLGLNTTLVKYISSSKKDPASRQIDILTNIRLTSLFIISIVFFIVSKVFILFDHRINQFVIQSIFLFVLNSLREFYYAQLQGLRKFKQFVFVIISEALAKFLAILIGSILNIINLDFLIYTEIGVVVLSFIIQQFLVPVKIRINFKFKFQDVKSILKFAYPLYFNNLLSVVNNRTNAFIISGFVGTVSLAYYEVANKIPDALNRIYNSFILVFFPNISSLISENKKNDAAKFIYSSIQSINLLLLPIIIVIYVFQYEITITLFTEQYIESSFAIFLFMIAFYFSSVSSITGYSLVALNKNILSFYSLFFGVLTGLITSLFLTPLFGFNGAVTSIVISRFISSGLGIYYLDKESIKLSHVKALVPLLFCAPFIFVYELIGLNHMLIKIILVILFILIEIVTFKEFRNVLIKILRPIKIFLIKNIKRLTNL